MFFLYAGNIEKCPFTYSYWLNGRWFLQIVDIHVGNLNMKLTGRWFPQIVDRDSGNLYPIYIYNKNCGVSFWTCSREISGDRVALFIFNIELRSHFFLETCEIYIYNQLSSIREYYQSCVLTINPWIYQWNYHEINIIWFYFLYCLVLMQIKWRFLSADFRTQ